MPQRTIASDLAYEMILEPRIRLLDSSKETQTTFQIIHEHTVSLYVIMRTIDVSESHVLSCTISRIRGEYDTSRAGWRKVDPRIARMFDRLLITRPSQRGVAKDRRGNNPSALGYMAFQCKACTAPVQVRRGNSTTKKFEMKRAAGEVLKGRGGAVTSSAASPAAFLSAATRHQSLPPQYSIPLRSEF